MQALNQNPHSGLLSSCDTQPYLSSSLWPLLAYVILRPHLASSLWPLLAQMIPSLIKPNRFVLFKQN